MLCIHVNAKTIGKTIITKVADKGVQYLMLRLYVNFKTTLTPYSYHTLFKKWKGMYTLSMKAHVMIFLVKHYFLILLM